MTIGLSSFAQNKLIRGKVTGDDGVPMSSVTVVFKGTTQGTVASIEGLYSSTEVLEDAILNFSFVEMKSQEFPVSGITELNVVLHPSEIGLDEVVGYVIQKKGNVTGSVVSVSPKDIEDLLRVCIEQMFQVVATGFSNTMVVRGENSISASNTSLIILDGVPYLEKFLALNLRDIASMKTLKDASSIAFYGSCGPNGVFLIISKRGEKGKHRVSHGGSYAINTVINVSDLMDGTTFYETKINRGLSVSRLKTEVLLKGELPIV